jgi:hypothetical protein
MLALQNLANRGYIVLYDAVPDVVVDHLRSLSRGQDILWIHDTIDGVLQDEDRFRAFVPDSTSRALSVDLERHYRTFFPEATATEWRFLKTVAGAADQQIRRVFLPVLGEDATNVHSVPGSIFVATQDHTCFYGFGWNKHVALRSNRVVIELNKGDLLMNRGDFIFGGVGYDTNNVVIHGYLDMPMFERPLYNIPTLIPLMDDTRVQLDPFCFVWGCPFVGSDDNSLRKHLNRYHNFFFRRIQAAVPVE